MCVFFGQLFKHSPLSVNTQEQMETFSETPHVTQTACAFFKKSTMIKETKTWDQEKSDSRGFQIFWLILAWGI